MSRKVADIVPQGLVKFLPTIVKVPWVSWTYVRGQQISDENLFQVRPALDAPKAEVFELGPC